MNSFETNQIILGDNSTAPITLMKKHHNYFGMPTAPGGSVHRKIVANEFCMQMMYLGYVTHRTEHLSTTACLRCFAETLKRHKHRWTIKMHLSSPRIPFQSNRQTRFVFIHQQTNLTQNTNDRMHSIVMLRAPSTM